MKVVPEKPKPDSPDPLAAPDWFVQRAEELSRLMSSSPKSVADGLWYELIQRGLVAPQPVPGRVLGWKGPQTTETLTRPSVATLIKSQIDAHDH